MPWKERRKGGWLIVDDVTVPGTRKYDFARTAIIGDEKVRRLRAIKAASRHLIPGTAISIEELLERWRIAKLSENVVKPERLSHYIDTVRKVAGARNWTTTASITRDELRKWAVDSGNVGVKRERSYLLAMLRVAVSEWDVAVDPKVLARRWERARVPDETSPLLTDADALAIQTKADTYPPTCGLVVHWMARYGPRPITLAKMLARDVSLERGDAWLGHMKNGRPLRFPLFADTIARLRVVMEGLAPEAHLFRSMHNKPWTLRPANGGAEGLTRWYTHSIDKRGIYELKRLAITRMFQGTPPWTAPLTLADVKLFTGHTSDEPLRYQRTNDERARALIGPVGITFEVGASRRELVQAEIPQTPDFTVKYE